MEYRDILVERHALETRRPRSGRIVINRPDQLNALRMTITDRELIHALDGFEADAEVRAVILTGAGERAFSTRLGSVAD